MNPQRQQSGACLKARFETGWNDWGSILCVAPDSPQENGYVESLHSKIHNEFLNSELFENLRSARLQAER